MLPGMRIEFLKMQGLGNDFLVFDAAALAADAHLDERTLRALADRHTGVGFDQALMLETPRDVASRVFYRVFNSDGIEVEQCGNGARCVAALMYARAPELGRDLIMGSRGGKVRARIRDDGLVSVDMGIPVFAEPLSFSLNVAGQEVQMSAVSLGNPHVVLQVPEIKSAPVEQLGPGLERHPHFPNRTMWASCKSSAAAISCYACSNAGRAKPWPAVTGACAAVALGLRQAALDGKVQVDLPGGTAMVFLGGSRPAYMADRTCDHGLSQVLSI